MSNIDRQVRNAHRRLSSNIFLDRLALGLAIAVAVWTLWIVAQRIFALEVAAWPGLVVALLTALIIAGVGLWLARVDRVKAAIAIDGAAGLKERVSTAVTLRDSHDPFAQATLHDAERVAGSVHLPTHLPYRAPRNWPLPSTLFAVAVIVYAFMPTLDLFAAENEEDGLSGRATTTLDREQVELAVREHAERAKARLEKSGRLAGLAKDLDELTVPDDPDLDPEDLRREVVRKVENVSDKIRQQLESGEMKALEALKRDLARLDMPKGDDPASKLAEAMSEGDTKGAQDALAKMKEDLAEAAKAAENNPEMKARLKQMEQKLDALAKQMEKLAENKAMQKELQNKAGLSEEEARKLAEKLAKMDPQQLQKALEEALKDKNLDKQQLQQMAQKMMQQQQTREQLKQMAKAMQKAAQSAQQCQNPGQSPNGAAQAGMQAIGEAMDMMSEMEMAEQMMNELEGELSELDDLKDGVCQGFGQDEGDPGDKIGNQGRNAGRGYGARTGTKTAAFQYKARKVKLKNTGGQVIGQMLVDGPQLKGEAMAEARDAVNAAVREATDAIEREEAPRQYAETLKQYFDRLAGLAEREAEDASSD